MLSALVDIQNEMKFITDYIKKKDPQVDEKTDTKNG